MRPKSQSNQIKSSKSEKNHPIRHYPIRAYKFDECPFNFSPQRSRIIAQARPMSSSFYVSGNTECVYKNCAQLSKLPKAEQLLNDLNDTLFSHAVHPNSGVTWNLLYSVIVHQPDDYVCPICLFPPKAARMTHCGHIFCVDCLQRYCMESEIPLCPVCGKKIHSYPPILADLRLYPKSDHFTFKKTLRNHENCICFLPGSSVSFLPTASEPSSLFSHITIADSQYIEAQIQREKLELTEQIKIYSEDQYLDTTKISLLESYLQSANSNIIGDITFIEQSKSKSGKSISQTETPPESTVPEITGDGPRFLLPSELPLSRQVIIYQDENGILTFFDPLTIKMLVEHFGNLNQAPDIIEVQALKTESIPVDAKFKKIYRNYGYLPMGAQVTLVTADLSSIVSKKVISKFSAELEKKLRMEEEIVTQPEEENRLIINDFPSLDSEYVDKVQNVNISEKTKSTLGRPKSTGVWQNLNIEQSQTNAFPSLSEEPQPFKKKNIGGWGNLSLDSKNPTSKFKFPSLSSTSNPKK